MAMVHLAPGSGCCHASMGKGEILPLTLSQGATASMGLLGSVPSLEVAQSQADANSLLF